VDRLVALQFDRHGNRVWRQAKALLDCEHAHRVVGEVVVPFGTCAEPSNVAGAGHACPYRFRCVGCNHFSTDASYLPDLQTYLDDLLRAREKLLAAHPDNDCDDPGQGSTDGSGIDTWARREATPSLEEITRIRRLIDRISGDLQTFTEAAQPAPDVHPPRPQRQVSR
jgi:hypothetical protein